jgi:8-oxo-dGTP diphosphatase
VRHYFQLAVDGEVPQRWEALERGDGEPTRFELYWIPLAQAHVVGGGQAAPVGRMAD